MPAQRSTSMTEGLVSLITSIAQMKLAGDADVAFLNDLEAQIATKARELQAAELAGQAGQIAPTSAGNGADMMGQITPGMAPGPTPMGSMGMPDMGMGPMPGPMPQGPPNADELRRTLTL